MGKTSYCMRCGTELREAAKFCDGCGTPTGLAGNRPTMYEAVDEAIVQKRKRYFYVLVSVGALAIALGIVLFLTNSPGSIGSALSFYLGVLGGLLLIGIGFVIRMKGDPHRSLRLVAIILVVLVGIYLLQALMAILMYFMVMGYGG